MNCQLHASAALMPREINVGSHLRGGCLGPRGGEENMRAPTWNWNTCPYHRQTLYGMA